MKKFIWAVWALAIYSASFCLGAPLRFEKLSDHCYYLPLKEQDNFAAVITDEGILAINPPAEASLTSALDALKRLSTKPVRWVAFTDIRYLQNAGTRYFAEHGAVLIASEKFRDFSARSAGIDAQKISDVKTSFLWFYFGRQMHLFPSNLEIRIFAVQSKARSGSDIVVFVPAEKVLFTGALYEFPFYPDIDTESGGDALGWIDGMKQVIASVPVLKQAIPPKSQAKPQAKTAPKTEPEKTLEEAVIVVSARDGVSNLQNMKDLLEAAQKLRDELARRVKMGRVCEDFLLSGNADPYRSFGNLEAFVGQLCGALTPQTDASPSP
jgi:hypothetical protein